MNQLVEDRFLAKFLLACTNQTTREKHSVSGYQGIVNELIVLIKSSLPEDKKQLITNCNLTLNEATPGQS